jgi:protein-L-isoaspartate(D-aspartate) O-methyltransferase
MTGNRHVPGPADLAVAAQVAGVRDQRVLDAIRSTPREAFVPARYAGMAYADQPVPISHGQVGQAAGPGRRR